MMEMTYRYPPATERSTPADDAVHDQKCWVTKAMQQTLIQQYGVKTLTITQCVGDAVFIPAGPCPAAATRVIPDAGFGAGALHQVFNNEANAKLAVDFVSPEHIDAVLQLTGQFRT